MVVPAAFYVAFNWGGPGMNGWGVPMATDIAFALGILALVGSRVPFTLKIFLTALAIIDDLGAVLIIALFYTSDISTNALVLAAWMLFLMVSLNRLQIRNYIPYLLLGIVLWFAFLKSGVHATVAGVLAAMTIPARPKIDGHTFARRTRTLINKLRGTEADLEKEKLKNVRQIRAMSVDLESPLHRLEHDLHPWTTYLVIPVFALANAGVTFSLDSETMFHPVTMGVFMGLLLGKQLGVLFFSWVAVKAGWAVRPEGVTWMHIYGAGWLAGVGFTMSLFITNLAFTGGELITMSKVGIIMASFFSGVGGYLILRYASRKQAAKDEKEAAFDGMGTPAEAV
jgi:NhaA family Na+:H+ antiporter